MNDIISFMKSRRATALLISLWLFSMVLLCASVAVFLNRTDTLIRLWQHAPLTNIQPETGFAYIAATKRPELSSHEKPSSARVLENGVPLPGPSNSIHDDIRKIGKGRFSFWADYVYLSASDNTDPRTNGRSYEISYPKFFGSVFAQWLYGLTALVCIIAVLFSILVVKHRRLTAKFLWLLKSKALFAISCTVAGPRVLAEHVSKLFGQLKICRLGGKTATDTTTFLKSRRATVLVISFWLFSMVLLCASVAVFLDRTGTLIRFWQRAPLTNIQPETGFAYIAATRRPELSSHEKPSSARVLENGVPLPGPSNSTHDDIRKIGKGRFSFWADYVYLSASDNTDPRINGRRYEIFFPKFFGSFFPEGIYGLTALVCATALFFSMLLVKQRKLTAKFLWLFNPKALFVISCVVVTLAYLIPRLPWFVDYPLAIIQYDTRSYFEPVRQMFFGKWPDFIIRSPGYPFFLATAFLISSRLMFVIVLQNLLTLTSALFFVWVIYRIYGRLVIGAALSMLVHVAQPLLSGHDFMLVTESLFTSCLLFCLGLFFLAIHTRRPRYFLLFSALAGYTVFVRPAGAFLAGLLLVTLLYLVINRYPRKSILCLILPMPAMLVILMTYNYIRSDYFTLSDIRALTLYGMTATYWEEDKAFPESVNAGIRRFSTDIPEQDRKILRTSWNPIKLNPLFANAAGCAIYTFKYGVFSSRVIPGLGHRDRLNLAKQIARKAILSHPGMAVKFFWATLCCFLLDESSWQTYFYNDIALVAKQMYIEGTALDKFVGREYAELPKIKTLRLEGDLENRHFVVVPTLLSRIYFHFGGFLRRIFDSKGWLLACFIVLLTSLFITIREKFRHRGAFIVFSVSSLLFAAGMVVALTTSMTNRYPSPTRFVEVLSVVLIPLLSRSGGGEPQVTSKSPGGRRNPEDTNVSTCKELLKKS